MCVCVWVWRRLTQMDSGVRRGPRTDMATRDPAAVARLLHVLVGRSGGAAGGRASPVMAVTGESASAKRQRTNLWGLPLARPPAVARSKWWSVTRMTDTAENRTGCSVLTAVMPHLLASLVCRLFSCWVPASSLHSVNGARVNSTHARAHMRCLSRGRGKPSRMLERQESRLPRVPPRTRAPRLSLSLVVFGHLSPFAPTPSLACLPQLRFLALLFLAFSLGSRAGSGLSLIHI